jgi:hypothetical protein
MQNDFTVTDEVHTAVLCCQQDKCVIIIMVPTGKGIALAVRLLYDHDHACSLVAWCSAGTARGTRWPDSSMSHLTVVVLIIT